jgi:hypothetical protein
MINGAKSAIRELREDSVGLVFPARPLSPHFLPLLALASLRYGVLNMKLLNSYNRRTHPAFPSNEAEAAIEAARQEVATASEAEQRFAAQPTDSRKKEI